MAAPKLSETYIKNPTKITLLFDQPLDDSVFFPPTCFSVNYGRIPISAAEYYGTSKIILVLSQAITHEDKLEVNYQPPDDLQLALRGTVPNSPTATVIRRNAIRAFFKVPIKNMLAVDETDWSANSNLGGGRRFVPNGESPDVDVSLPGFDICGDGSVIIGNPENIININPHGHILEIGNLFGGSGYTNGEWERVPLAGGGADNDGARARVSIQVENGSVTAAVLTDGGRNYNVGDILEIPGLYFGNETGTGASVEVIQINNLWNQAQQAGVIPAANGGSSGSNAPPRIQDLPYPIYDRPTPRSATPDDFVMAYGLREATQISNIDNAEATQPNNAKIWMAIEDACALIDNYISGATRAGKILISSSRRRTSLIIARYYLDTVRRREDVKGDYERAIIELDKSRTLKDVTRPELPWWADPCNPWRGTGGVRSHRIPQYYNGVSGKGLSGYWVDSGNSEVDDWRYDRDNAEGNNDSGNAGGAGYNEGRNPSQPTDEGGVNEGGDMP
jgi:phage gp36-like protein